MTRLRDLLDRSRWSALASGMLGVGLALLTVANVLLGNYLWAGFALAATVLVLLPSIVHRDPGVTLPWPLVATTLLVVLVRTLDGAGTVSRLATYLSVAAVALILAVELDAFSPVKLTPRLGVVFVVLATMATAAVWVVVQWTANVLVNTGFYAQKAPLMWYLVGATVAGLVAGATFELYVREADDTGGSARFTGANRMTDDATTDDANVDDVEVLPENRKRQATRVLQAVLVGILAYGVVIFDGGLILNAGIGLAVTFLPGLLRRDFSVPMDPALTLGIALAVLVHAVGTLGPYTAWGWYDQVAHFISATVVAAVGYATARAVVLHEEDAHVPRPYMFVFILVFVLAFGVLWEIMEFAIEGISSVLGLGAPLTQYGIDDIVLDLVADAVGGLVVAIWGTARLSGFARSLAGRLAS